MIGAIDEYDSAENPTTVLCSAILLVGPWRKENARSILTTKNGSDRCQS